MKTQNIFPVVVLLIASLFLINAAFEGAQPAPSVMYQQNFSVAPDTLTDTGTETFLVPGALHSKWSAGWFFTATELTGTTNITCTVYEKGYDDSEWEAINTLDLDGTSSGRITIATVYGKSQKCDCVGTGTQSTQIDAWVIYKKD